MTVKFVTYLTRDGEGVTQLALACPELSKKFSDGASLDAAS